MQIDNHQIVDYDAVLDAKFGAEGTPERAEAEEKAYAFYTGQIIEDARKKAKITQAELARRIGSDRSYISRVESGQTEPKVSTFYRIMNALGCRIEFSMSYKKRLKKHGGKFEKDNCLFQISHRFFEEEKGKGEGR